MEYFDYTVKNHLTGKRSKGVISADNIEMAEDTLKRRGESIVVITPMSDFMNIRKSIYNFSTRTNKRTKCEFFAMVKYMLESGIPLHETLMNIRDTSTNKSIRALARDAADEVRKGASLSGAIKKTNQFDPAIIEQINAGEESANINECLGRIIMQMEREMEFKGKIKSAMMYPILICVVMVVVLWVMMTLVVPALAETLISMGGELPLITKIVIGVSNFMSGATPYIVIGIILGVIGYKFAIKIPSIKLKVDTYKLKIPLVGKMLEKIELSRFCSNLSAMQKSGIPLVASLKTVESAVRNKKIAMEIENAAHLVEVSGLNLSTALSKSGSFPQIMIQLIEIGIESGQICEVLERVSLQYEKETDASLKRISSLIEPIMILVVGLLAGIVVISIFLPMFEMTENLGV